MALIILLSFKSLRVFTLITNTGRPVTHSTGIRLCKLYIIESSNRTGRSIVEAHDPVYQSSINHAVVDESQILHVQIAKLPAAKVVDVVVDRVDGGVRAPGV